MDNSVNAKPTKSKRQSPKSRPSSRPSFVMRNIIALLYSLICPGRSQTIHVAFQRGFGCCKPATTDNDQPSVNQRLACVTALTP
jgi:hypothetical protein